MSNYVLLGPLTSALISPLLHISFRVVDAVLAFAGEAREAQGFRAGGDTVLAPFSGSPFGVLLASLAAAAVSLIIVRIYDALRPNPIR